MLVKSVCSPINDLDVLEKKEKMLVTIIERIENIVGNGENASYQHFLLFPQCFQKAN